MTCPQCAFENPPAMAFCGRCGTKLASLCPSCGFANPEGFAFCGKCGVRVADAPAQPRQISQSFASPQSYTPKHLAEKILTSKAALEGERKQVTVLFADLKGSMELLADRDPEEARKLLDPVLERMMEAVHRYEGTVNQVMGDGIMALFGAPLAHEDHAVRACYAALRMQASVKQYAEEVRRTQGISVRIRIGLNSGEVVVRAVGSDLRMDYTAVGQTTHLAARMEQLADPGSTLLTPDTLARAEGHIEVRALGPLPVKGLADPMEVYEMLGASTIRSRFQAAAARGLSRFVGRTGEIEQLHEALDHVRAGRGQVVGVVGEPGVGKSRLYHEFTLSHRVQGCFVLASVSVSYGKAAAYFPIIDLLRTYFRIEWRDDPRTIREKVTGRLLSLDRALEPFLPAFLWLLDVPTDDPDWEHLDPPQRRRQILDGVKRLLLRESQAQPLVVIFEDLHWIDAETQALVDALVEGLPAARVLMLVNYRPEYQHVWGSKTYYRQLRIDPLPAASARELLDALLGDDATVQPLKGLLIQRTEGTPFFLEEGVRALVETGVLTGDRGSYRLLRSLDTIEVPATVKALLASRIDRLASEDKSVLQAASVIGTDVPFDVLEAVAGVPRDELRRHLDQLQSAEFLYETALFPALEYTFKHALTHEVTYGSLLGDRRRTLHARIVEAIERLYADRLGEQIERLAHHAFRGEAWDRAAAYALQAGRRAVDRSATLEARRYAEQGLAAADRLPRNRETLEATFDLDLVLGLTLFAMGEPQRLLTVSEAMLATAEGHGDQRRVVRAKVVLANTLWFLGQNHRALPMVEDALAAAESIRDLGLQVGAGLDLGLVCRTMGNYRRAVEVLDRVLGQLVGPLAKDRLERALFPFVTARNNLSGCLAELGELERASVVASESVSFAEAIRHPASLATACGALAYPLLVHGRFDEAIPLLERAVEISHQPGLAAFHSRIAAYLGMAYAGAGRFTQALPLVTDSAPRGPQMIPHNQGLALAALAEVSMRAGMGEAARAAAQRTVEFSRTHAERGTEARGLWLLAEATFLPDRPDLEAVESGYRQALALADVLGMRPLVAHCHLGLGKLYRRTGKQQEAQEHLTTATTMYREMDMRFWLEQAEAEMASDRPIVSQTDGP